MTPNPPRRKGNRRKLVRTRNLVTNLNRKDGKQPATVIPVFGPGAQVQFRVSVDGPNVIISMNLPVLHMVTTPENVRRFAAALITAADKAEGFELPDEAEGDA